MDKLLLILVFLVPVTWAVYVAWCREKCMKGEHHWAYKNKYSRRCTRCNTQELHYDRISDMWKVE